MVDNNNRVGDAANDAARPPISPNSITDKLAQQLAGGVSRFSVSNFSRISRRSSGTFRRANVQSPINFPGPVESFPSPVPGLPSL